MADKGFFVMPTPFDFGKIDVLLGENLPLALCTVIETKGSTPRKLGTKMLVQANATPMGRIEGTIGGGAVEHFVRKKALEILEQGTPQLVEIALSTELGMCCGGQMSVFIEPLTQKPLLLVLGAGHIGQALSHLGIQMGFEVIVADPREELLDHENFPARIRLLGDYSAYDLEKIQFSSNTYVIVVTHDHQMDQKLIEKILNKDFAFAGLIGSRRKARLTVQRCLNKGFSIKEINRLFCPAGLDINAETPYEIALSVMAQITQVRRQDIPVSFQSEIQEALKSHQKDIVA